MSTTALHLYGDKEKRKKKHRSNGTRQDTRLLEAKVGGGGGAGISAFGGEAKTLRQNDTQKSL